MRLLPLISFFVHLTVSIWLFVILLRRAIWRQLPWFACYIASELVGACVGLVLWSVNRRLYVTVYWWMAAAQITLIVGAVRESFVRTFVGFRSLGWFPWLVRGVIAAVLAYAWWKAIYAPPVQNNRIVSLIVDGEFTFRWAIVAVGLLSVFLERLFTLPRDTREVAVIDGCVVASFGGLAWAVIRSLFGTKYALVTQYFGEVAYLLACSLWIKYMSRTEAELAFEDLGMSPDQVASELVRYRAAAERLLKRQNNE